MSLFKYKAVDSEGKLLSGEMEAGNENDLEQRLEHMGQALVSCKERTPHRFSLGGQKIGRRELISFCFYLEQLSRAGVPLMEGLRDLRDTVENPRFKEIVANLVDEIEGGKMLSEALALHPRIFDNLFVNLVKTGEYAGQLSEIFGKLAESLKWQDELAAQTKKLIMYPAFVGVVVLGVVMFMMIFLVPQLVGFIKNMGQELPLHTKVLIAVSDFMIHFWYLVLATPIALTVLVKYLSMTSAAFRFRLDGFKLRVWIIGPILRKIILARFATFFAMMYTAGVSILESIRICEGVANNLVIAQGLERAGRQISEGQGFTASFQSTGLFPPLVIRMLRVGESTGALDEALKNVSYFYDRDVKESIARVQTLIEPVLTVVLGLIMGWIMLSVLGPIYDTISKMKT
ncbi:MAG: type II secretion system F family protein [Sulfuricellaceae bacterium]|nr:type II secretion system F family protein [Sulfuricellaceae bacterium]